MREIWFALMGIMLLTGAAPSSAQNAAPPPAATAAETATALALTPDDRILGKPDAPITIIEYASLDCPHCAHFAEDVLPKLKQSWIDSGKAKLVMRDFPLDEQALRAALVARCAPPDRFYAIVDTFMQAQARWVGARDYRDTLARLVKLGGMGQQQFDSCIDDKAAADKVAASRLIAEQIGVNATPTFFINGVKYEGEPSAEAMNRALTSVAAKS